MSKWIPLEQVENHPEASQAEISAAMECCVAQVRNNLPAFRDHFPAANSENNFYTPGPNTDWTSGFWTGEVWLAYENAKTEEDRACLLYTSGLRRNYGMADSFDGCPPLFSRKGTAYETES